MSVRIQMSEHPEDMEESRSVINAHLVKLGSATHVNIRIATESDTMLPPVLVHSGGPTFARLLEPFIAAGLVRRISQPHLALIGPESILMQRKATPSTEAEPSTSSELADDKDTKEVVKHAPRSQIRVGFIILVWMVISITLIMHNKWLLSYKGYKFPLAMTMTHQATTGKMLLNTVVFLLQ